MVPRTARMLHSSTGPEVAMATGGAGLATRLTSRNASVGSVVYCTELKAVTASKALSS